MKSKISGEASDKVCYKGLWYLRHVALFTKACTLFVVELQLKKIPQFMGVLQEENNLIFSDMNEISHL